MSLVYMQPLTTAGKGACRKRFWCILGLRSDFYWR